MSHECLWRFPAAELIFALLWAWSGSVVADQRQRCSCPTIKAEGRGQTDCSGVESGGQCTIDFNAFGLEVEEMAAKRLRDAGFTGKVLPVEQGPASLRLLKVGGDKQMLADQVLVYLTVSSALRPDVNTSEIKALADVVRTAEVRDALAIAFGSEAFEAGNKRMQSNAPERLLTPRGESKQPTKARRVGNNTFVSPGCAEVRLNKSWFMYKANWAEAYNEDRCGEPR